MKKIVPLAILVIMIVSVSFVTKDTSPAKAKGYKISGMVQGYPDSTLLYLVNRDKAVSVTIDSTYILHGQFGFSGAISGNAAHVTIETKNLTDYKFFWLENTAITFNAVKGNFHNAIIIGSTVQNDADKLSSLLLPADKEIDSLNNQINKNTPEAKKADLGKRIDSLRAAELITDMDFIKANPASIVSAYILDVYSSSLAKEKAALLYKVLSPENKNTAYGRNIFKYITLNKNLNIGDHYADFAEKDSSGREVKISDYPGKVLLIDFWASWCSPCRHENPGLVKTYALFKNNGFEIVGVSLDAAKKDWTDAIKEDALSWPNISELKGDKCDAALMYGISSIPDNFLIDRTGIILARNLRGQALRDKLQELLK